MLKWSVWPQARAWRKWRSCVNRQQSVGDGRSSAKPAASETAVADVRITALERRVARPRSAHRRQPLLQHPLRRDEAGRRQDHVGDRQGPARRPARPRASHALRVQGAHRQGRTDQSVLQRRHRVDARPKLVADLHTLWGRIACYC